MLICIFAASNPGTVTAELEAGKAGIDEEQVADSAPMVRALIVQRLEQVWRACEPHINPSPEVLESGFRRDPRYIEAGLRVLDRLALIYLRLPRSGPQNLGEGPEELQEAQDKAMLALDRLESKQDEAESVQ